MGAATKPSAVRCMCLLIVQTWVLITFTIVKQSNAWTLFPRPSLPKRLAIRGFDRTYYGLKNNATIPDPYEVAAIVGVKPCTMAPKQVWKIAWRLHGAVLPLLHLGDKAKPRDSKYSLKVLWCKAIASMDRTSKVYDDSWTYDTLPSASRWLLRVLPTRLFPRLHHANIEARTAYLDKIITEEMERFLKDNNANIDLTGKIRLISLGAGYDIRCSRLLSQYSERPVDMDAYELDLENVVTSKNLILDRLKRRRPGTRHPTLITMDLNDVNGTVKQTLEDITSNTKDQDETQRTHTIFISEGVMIYLNQGVPSSLLKVLGDIATKGGSKNSASFCFADRLENVPGGDINAATIELSKAGWDLIDFCPKPGLARHMGVARLR